MQDSRLRGNDGGKARIAVRFQERNFMNEQENKVKIEARTLKGFRDYGPAAQVVRQEMMRKLEVVFERFGFFPLSTPVLEYKDILMGKYGEDEKLVYSFKDNGDRDVAMRYDLTVPLARYVAQNQNEITLPFKRYQMAPVWRADNPQKGRLREFMQCDVDVIGSDSPLADADVLACVCAALDAIGVTKYQLRLNSRILFTAFCESMQLNQEQSLEVIRAIDKVKKIGIDGVTAILVERQIPEPAIGQVKKYLALGEGDSALDGLATQVSVSLALVADTMRNFIALLKQQGVREEVIVFDPSIARGLDYYTGFVFEITLTDYPDFGSVGSGGRYDDLLSQFSNQKLPSVGCSIGFGRLFEAMEDQWVTSASLIDVLILNVDPAYTGLYVLLASALRKEGLNVDLYYQSAKFDKQFKYAEAKNIPYAVIIGEEEKSAGTVKIKNLQTREHVEVKMADVVSYFKSKK